MGRRGPPPTPAKVLELRGSRLAKDRLAEVQPECGDPVMPSWLGDDEVARGRWEWAVGVLGGMGILSPRDSALLEAHCRAYSEWRTCCAYVDANGLVNEIVTKENGTHRKEHPEACRAKQLLPILQQQLRELGLTPAARLAPRAEEPPAKGRDKTRFFGT